MKGETVISQCRQYRYSLVRTWLDGWQKSEGRIAWVMLNPSTADADKDDPTVKRVIHFSKIWGFGSLVVVNLFAFRATMPSVMKAADDPIGPDNDRHIAEECANANRVIVAWGTNGTYLDRGKQVLEMLSNMNIKVKSFRLTKNRQPRHPLYVSKQAALYMWKG